MHRKALGVFGLTLGFGIGMGMCLQIPLRDVFAGKEPAKATPDSQAPASVGFVDIAKVCRQLDLDSQLAPSFDPLFVERTRKIKAALAEVAARKHLDLLLVPSGGSLAENERAFIASWQLVESPALAPAAVDCTDEVLAILAEK